MNPFLKADWKPKPLFGNITQTAQPIVNGLKKQGRGGTVTSLISEGGAAGGALAGAALGSVVPVVGTAIGGILGAGAGAFAGRLAENKIRDDEYRVGDAGKEAALSAVLAGPLKGLKYAGSAGKAIKGGATLEKALMTGADDAAKFTLRGSLGKGVDKAATNYATKQFGLQPAFIGKFTKMYKEDPGKLIQRYGFSTADDIEQQIAKQNQVFGTLVEGAGSIKKNTIKRELDGIAMDLVNQGPSQQKAMGAKLLQETDQLLNQFDDEIPASAVNQLKGQYDSLVNYARQQADPNTYDVNKRVADVLRKSIQKASGSSQLKETGMEISKLINLSDEAGKRAAALGSRGASPISLRNTMGVIAGGSATGGMMGGLPGAIAGGIGTAALNSPTGRRTAFKGANAAAKLIGKGTGKATSPLGMATTTAVRQPIEGMINQPAPSQAQSLEDVFIDQSQSEGPSSIQSTLPSAMTSTMSGNGMPGLYPETQQSSSGITRENILQAMMMDMEETGGENFSKIKMLYDFANPDTGTGGLKLGNPAIARISDFESGIAALDNLGGQIDKSGVNNPGIGTLRRLNPFDTSAQDLNSEIRTVRQLVGRALEGGVLRREDEIKYEQMLPRIGDTDATARKKIENVRALLTGNLNAYQQNQYNFGGNASIEDAMLLSPHQQGAY